MSRWVVSFVAAIATSSVAAHAHHSIWSVYDSNRRITIEGIVAQFQLINPHPLLLVDVTDQTGNVVQWRLEMDNRYELVAIGVSANTFKRGDRVVVTGSPARKLPRSLYILRLDRPTDGFWYEQIGESPRIASVS